MLKKSLFSPAQPRRAETRFHQHRCRLESILNVAQEATPPVLSSAAALLDGLFEHPARHSSVVMDSKLKKQWYGHRASAVG